MKELLKSLADFQQEVPIIHKGSKGYGYTYADLPTVFEIITPLLKKHGLGFYQAVNSDGLKTVVFHKETGELIESNTTLPILSYERTLKIKDEKEVEVFIIPGFEGMNMAQAMGSLITYFRRYALSSLLGLVTDKDADARNKKKPESEDLDENVLAVWQSQVNNIKNITDLEIYWNQNIDVVKGNKAIMAVFTKRKKELNGIQMS